jgi:tRNA threonylcarbamoyladenosine biosynthesis protein TsaB
LNESPLLRPLLALETSGNSLGVALISDEGVLFEENVTEGMIHGRALVPLMQSALTSRGLRSSELSAVAVSLGPGSWTGLRIGIAAAKAFAWAAGVPLVGVPSFEALALEAGGTVLTVRDARSEGFFAAIFAVTDGEPKRLLSECVLKAPEVVEAARSLNPARLNVCGDEKCLAQLAPDIAANGWLVKPELQHIPARAVAQCAWRRVQSGEGIMREAAEKHKLAPLYLRASDPELKLNKTIK